MPPAPSAITSAESSADPSADSPAQSRSGQPPVLAIAVLLILAIAIAFFAVTRWQIMPATAVTGAASASGSASAPASSVSAASVLPSTAAPSAATSAAPAAESSSAPAGNAEVRQLRVLRFDDAPDGSVAVIDVGTGQLVQRFEGEQGFLRGTLRAMARERRLHGLGAGQPFELILLRDGRLTLHDPATGMRIALESFGSTNTGVFARLLR